MSRPQLPSYLRNFIALPAAILLAIADAASAHPRQAILLHTREASNVTTIPAPISVTPDSGWYGTDGSWSTFTLRLGTPPQTVHALLSFKSYQTLAVLPQGCEQAEDQSACAQARGGLFNETASSTFDKIGIYGLSFEDNLGFDGNAIFGYDVVGIGATSAEGPTLKNATIGGFAVEDFNLGIFGVDPKPTNFTNFNDGSPSFISLLYEQNIIPSVSFGYTAGAKYRSSSGVPASLVLGGYDSAKFLENNLTFTFAEDNSRNLVVAVQSITTPSEIESSPTPTELLPAPVYAYVDSTVPDFWLPIEACRAFEIEFGLVYDNTTELYVVNDTLHQALLDRNATVTLYLALGATGGETVDIVLPYAAFDLEAQPPYHGLSNSSRYFPLQRAQNSTQYTLGRAFMQEAYIAVDWEAQKFNISQVNWSQSQQQHLVPIIPTIDSSSGSQTDTNADASSSSPAGMIAGIVVGALAIIAIIALATAFYLRRRKRTRNTTDKADSDRISPNPTAGNVYPKAELEGSSIHPADHTRLLAATSPNNSLPGTPNAAYFAFINGHSLPTTPGGSSEAESGTHRSNPFSDASGSAISEADSRRIYEMPGDMPAIREKDGRALSEKEALQHRERVYNGVKSESSSSMGEGQSVTRENPKRVRGEDVVVVKNSITEAGERPGARRAFSFELQGNGDKDAPRV